MKAGDTAPDFTLPDENGTPRTLSTMLADGPVVLFFFPYAMTSGCTRESCHFRDMKSEYEQAGAQRVGISMDTVAKQKEFSDKHSFDYPLLADTEGEVAKSFGVKRGLLKKLAPVKRSTFVIGKDMKIVDVISSETKFELHADDALKSLARA
jgi:peroxiredoxin Q/BCP